MKTKNLILSGTMAMIALSLTITSCRKAPTNDTDTTGASDNALAESNFNDMNQASDEAARGSMSSYKTSDAGGILSICTSFTVTPNSDSSGTITVSFGSQPCLCNDGKYRQGNLFITYSAGYHHHGYWDSLCAITITTNPADNYYVGQTSGAMNQVIGTRTITNNGRNAANHMNWTISESGKIIKANGQGTITWSANRNREWTAGDTTPLLFIDDVYSITGTANGVDSKGDSFSLNITNPIVYEVSCAYHFISGKFDYTPGTKPIRHVDFSPPNNGACDNVATVTITGNSHVYTIYF